MNLLAANIKCRRVLALTSAGAVLLFVTSVAAQTIARYPFTGRWRAEHIVMNVVAERARGELRVRVRYADGARRVPVRDAQWHDSTRTLTFLLPGSGPRHARDHVGATTVELVLSDDGRRLAGRRVGMSIAMLTFERP